MTARASGVTTERLRQPGRTARLWIGVLAGPLVALAEQEAQYLLVPGACAGGRVLPLHATALIALLLILGSGLLATRELRRIGPEAEEAGSPGARGRFMAVVGILSSVVFGLGVVAHWLAVVILGVCRSAL
jgi:hypothetical protein